MRARAGASEEGDSSAAIVSAARRASSGPGSNPITPTPRRRTIPGSGTVSGFELGTPAAAKATNAAPPGDAPLARESAPVDAARPRDPQAMVNADSTTAARRA